MDDLYLEVLTRAAAGGPDIHLNRLNAEELRMVNANRLCYMRLMFGLAVKLEAGVKPGAAVK